MIGASFFFFWGGVLDYGKITFRGVNNQNTGFNK